MLMSRIRSLNVIISKVADGSHLSGTTLSLARNGVRFYRGDNVAYGNKTKCLVDRQYIPAPEYTGARGLLAAYRTHGHKKAKIDILNLQRPKVVKELEPSLFGLGSSDVHDVSGLVSTNHVKLSTTELVVLLDELYCGTMAVDFMHLQSQEERSWFAERFELHRQQPLSNAERIDAAKLMLRAQEFDRFLSSKFTTVKRYGGEGAESAMCFYSELFDISANFGIEDILMCIAHRGRLNLLTCLLKYPPSWMFLKMKGKREFPSDVRGAGDVLSHLTSSVDLPTRTEGRTVHVSMLPNPSHLEAANPVAAGKARARMQSKKVGDYTVETPRHEGYNPVLCFQVHGDAAFSAQGIVPETFELAYLPHFNIGGTIHFIINNQVGYTTEADHGRSSLYSADVGKIVSAPIILVNGDHPEDVIRAARLAVEYRAHFGRDVVVDYSCFRRWGHNELDEPSFTQPVMYKAIRSRASIPDSYAEQLVSEGVCAQEQLTADTAAWNQELGQQLAAIDSTVPKACHLEKQWAGLVQPGTDITVWDTGVDADCLRFVGSKSVQIPDGFDAHATLQRGHIERRLQHLREGTNMDWATAEALALGSLLHQGFHIRLSGQDVGRGTFSQRHAMLVDQTTDQLHIPLNHMYDGQQACLEVVNSPLSEEAVLGFEYGFSVENPRVLVMWEAQFGDFFNGAQIIIDTFVTSGETKWLLQSGLTMVLPHGMDGAGPEHSSCRLERFLLLCDSSETRVDGDSVNVEIANPTLPAQYFHLLRRQMIRNFRKPLIIAGPKMLLRHPAAVSDLTDMLPGTYFRPVIGDTVSAETVRRVVFVCGKHYYSLDKERKDRGLKDVALVRLEALCPFPAKELIDEVNKYKNASEFIWCQEEHRNSGAWSFVAPRFENVVGRKLKYIGRDVHATPASGVGEIHQQEVKGILSAVFP